MKAIPLIALALLAGCTTDPAQRQNLLTFAYATCQTANVAAPLITAIAKPIVIAAAPEAAPGIALATAAAPAVHAAAKAACDQIGATLVAITPPTVTPAPAAQ